MSQRVDVARWVRPAIEHAQDVLFWWVRPEVRVSFRALFLEGPVLVQTFMPFLLLVFSFVVSVLSFLQISNCSFWVCLPTFWCFVLLCSDSKVVLKRIIYPVLSWCDSSLGAVCFLFLVLLLGCGLWYLVSLRCLVWIII